MCFLKLRPLNLSSFSFCAYVNNNSYGPCAWRHLLNHHLFVSLFLSICQVSFQFLLPFNVYLSYVDSVFLSFMRINFRSPEFSMICSSYAVNGRHFPKVAYHHIVGHFVILDPRLVQGRKVFQR